MGVNSFDEEAKIRLEGYYKCQINISGMELFLYKNAIDAAVINHFLLLQVIYHSGQYCKSGIHNIETKILPLTTALPV